MTAILPTGKGTSLSADRFGPNGVIVLAPTAGDAALADANGRFYIIIQGGKLSPGRLLRPTNGSLRLADKDQKRLVRALRRNLQCVCECVSTSESLTERVVGKAATQEENDPPLVTSGINFAQLVATSGRFQYDREEQRNFDPPKFRLFVDSGGSSGGGADSGYGGGSDLRDAVADTPQQDDDQPKRTRSTEVSITIGPEAPAVDSTTTTGASTGNQDTGAGGTTGSNWSAGWSADDKGAVQDVINGIPNASNNPELTQGFKEWANTQVQFTRGTAGSTAPWLGVTPDRLNVEDSFLDSDNDPTAQSNVLTFELGKALWFRVNGSDAEVGQTQAGREFQKMLDQYPDVMRQMKFAPPVTDDEGDLPKLGDFGDIQSQFGYAVRVAVGNLGPPPNASPQVKRDWSRVVQAMQQYVMKNLPQKRK
jgi:hypothetical protein